MSAPEINVPTAKEVLKELASVEAKKASEEEAKRKLAEAENADLLEQLRKPSGVSREEAMKRVTRIIQNAVSNGLMEVRVYRFPNTLCTDRGRAINQQEAGWEQTLTGLPKEMYDFWKEVLQPRGYKLRYEIIDFPGGIPGDIGITLKWG
jgi:hypothetical protein